MPEEKERGNQEDKLARVKAWIKKYEEDNKKPIPEKIWKIKFPPLKNKE